ETSDDTVRLIKDLCAKLGKEAVEVRESPGFVVNRLLVPMMNEAFNLLQEGVASAEDIDKAMKLGTNMPMGPFELADYTGLDIARVGGLRRRTANTPIIATRMTTKRISQIHTGRPKMIEVKKFPPW